MAIEKILCPRCGQDKLKVQYYMSHSPVYKHNGSRVPLCKDCIVERYEELMSKYEDELKSLYHLCMNLDIHYDNFLALSLKSNIKEKEHLAKVYIAKVNSLQQYKGLTSVESNMIVLDETWAISEIAQNKEDEEDSVEIQITPAVIKRWGKGLSDEDYFFLESTYEEFTVAYDSKTPAQRLIFRQIAKALLKGEKAMREGDNNGFEKMNNLVSKLMSDSNIKPIQIASLAEGETEGWGVWVNRIESERPIGEPCEQFKDADKIGAYITKWFTKQMQRVFDLTDRSGEENDNQN